MLAIRTFRRRPTRAAQLIRFFAACGSCRRATPMASRTTWVRAWVARLGATTIGLATVLSLGVVACHDDAGAPQTHCGALQDREVTSSVSPFSVRYLGHCGGSLRDGVLPEVFRTHGASLYFQGTTDGEDAGLWVTDGTAAGTRLVVSSTTYSTGAATPFLAEIVPTDRGVFFALDRRCIFPMPITPGPPEPAPLWWTDTRGTTQILLGEHEVRGLALSGPRLFFRATGADRRPGLWTLDVSARQPSELRRFDLVSDLVPTTTGTVFFAAWEGEFRELWFSDGSATGTRAVTSGCETASSVIAVGPRAYFVCGRELWTSDGTLEGTRPVPGAPTGPTALYATLIELNGRLMFFYRPVAAETSVEIWASDGTAPGTAPLASFALAPHKPTGSPSLAAFGRLYFVVENTLWKSDGSAAGTAPVVLLPPRAALPEQTYAHVGGRFLATLGDSLVIVMNDAEPWRVDGATSEPVPVEAGVTLIERMAATPARLYYAVGRGDQPYPFLRTLRAWQCAQP